MALKGTAQWSFEHGYASVITPTLVNLEISGKKYSVFDITNSEVRFYNLDHSLWKTIHLPSFSGMTGSPYFASERLFNLDSKIEVIAMYGWNINGWTHTKLLLVNETGTVLDSVIDGSAPVVQRISRDTFKMMIRCLGYGVVLDTYKVYTLPGTLPCEECGAATFISKVNKKKNLLSDPAPNPSQKEVRITYTLPAGSKQGVIDLYSTNGKKIKSFKVDTTFNYITLDNSELPSGVYYYNLIADGEISVTKKMVVIK